jgi:hypothetical protein
MQMNVKHRLARLRSHIQHRAVTIFNSALPPNLRRHQIESPNQLGVLCPSLVQSANMLFRNDKHMRGRLGLNVLKRQGVLIFEHFLGGNLSAHNFAEQAIGHEHSLVIVANIALLPRPVQNS